MKAILIICIVLTIVKIVSQKSVKATNETHIFSPDLKDSKSNETSTSKLWHIMANKTTKMSGRGFAFNKTLGFPLENESNLTKELLSGIDDGTDVCSCNGTGSSEPF